MPLFDIREQPPELRASGRNRAVAIAAIVPRLVALRKKAQPDPRWPGGELARHRELDLHFGGGDIETYVRVTPRGQPFVFTAWISGSGKVHVMSWRRGWEASLF